MNPVNILIASVTRIEGALESAIAWGVGMAALLKTYANEPQAILDIAAELDAKADAAGKAIIANTPASPSSSVNEAANALATSIENDPAHPNNTGDPNPIIPVPAEPPAPPEQAPVIPDATAPAADQTATAPAVPPAADNPNGSGPAV